MADSQCPGTVVANDATYLVHHVSRPSAKLSQETRSFYSSYNGSHILPSVCEGASDYVDLDLTGRPPFQIMYNVARDNEMGGTKLLDQPVFSSIQPRTRFQLHTSEAARVYYEVKQIGDAAYPLAKNKNAVIPRSERLIFEQQVLQRPSARFKTTDQMSYCLNDALEAHDLSGSEGLVVLEGTPPFRVQLSIRNMATSAVRKETVEIYERSWKLHVPSYTFQSIGPHLVSIETVQDASNCEQAVPDTFYRTIRIDVAETAAIVPFDQRQDYCINDMLQFQLEGTPPWSIGYVPSLVPVIPESGRFADGVMYIYTQISSQRPVVLSDCQSVSVRDRAATTGRVHHHVHCAPAADVQDGRHGLAVQDPLPALCAGWTRKANCSRYS